LHAFDYESVNEEYRTRNVDLRRTVSLLLRFGVLCSTFVILAGCSTIRPPRGVPARTVTIEATGYCDCGQCCGWERVWWAPCKTVYAYGPNAGKPKKGGVTASGTKAHKGTIAADRRYYPFGTVMHIPGYGYGRVEDTGSAIQGPTRIDLFYGSHREALEWGRQRVSVKVWR
jgi:3D (Asp-Asp-Asp) domain-containing protein